MNMPPPLQSSGQPVPNYLVWAIIVTVLSLLLCCFTCISIIGVPTGIVAIVFASQVNTKLNAGDLSGAQQASKNAKLWSWITSGILIAAVLVTLVFYVVVGPEEYMNYMEQVRQQMEQQQR